MTFLTDVLRSMFSVKTSLWVCIVISLESVLFFIMKLVSIFRACFGGLFFKWNTTDCRRKTGDLPEQFCHIVQLSQKRCLLIFLSGYFLLNTHFLTLSSDPDQSCLKHVKFVHQMFNAINMKLTNYRD